MGALSSTPTDERITFLLDVLDEIAATDFVAHLQNAEIKQQLIADLARDTGIPGIFCKAIFWGFERLLAGVAEHGAQWFKTRFGQPTAHLIVRIPGSDRAIDWLKHYAHRLRDDAELRRYFDRIASGEEPASVAALPVKTRAETRLLVRLLEEAQLLQTAETTGLAEATKLPPLPRRRTSFVGREREKQQLAERLAGGGRATICAVAGMGGVGKTELALQVAGELGASSFPGGIVTIDLQGTRDPTAAAAAPLSPEAAMQRVLVQLDPTTKPPEDAEAVALAYRRALVGKRLLLILDNAQGEAQVTPLVPPEPAALLVTSRTRIALPEGLTLDLDTLDPGDAVALLKEEIGTARPLDDATLARFAGLCGNLPVALLAIAGTIKASRTRSPEQLLARLEADRAKGLTGVLDRLRPSVEALADDDRDLARRFARLAVFAGDFSIGTAAHVWEVDDDTACDGLQELLTRSLLLPAADDSPEPRFRLHDLIREIATERLGGDTDAAALRHAMFYKDLLARCQNLYLAGNDGVLNGLALFDRERAEITAGQRWVAGHADSEDTAASLAADYANTGIHVIALRLAGGTLVVWLKAALAACRRLGDRSGEAAAMGNLGNAWLDLGEARKAIEYYEQRLVFAREIGDRSGERITLNIGNAWNALGEPRKAIELYEQALAITREIGDRRSESSALCSLGVAWTSLGEPRKAIDFHEQALVISREIGDRRGEGSGLGELGNAWATLGEPRKALAFHEQWLVIAREIGDRSGEGIALGCLGNARAKLGEPRKAIELYEQWLVIAQEIGDRRGEGSTLWNMAFTYEKLGETDAALDRAKAAFVIFRAIEHPHVPQGAAWLRERGVDPDSL